MGIFNRLIAKVRGTSTASALDWKEIEVELLASDLGPSLVAELLESAKKMRGEDAEGAIKEILKSKLSKRERALAAGGEQKVILVVGVNGTGKTTSVAKLATHLHSQGKSVLLGAADTFRAAAVEQLRTWGERIGIETISGEKSYLMPYGVLSPPQRFAMRARRFMHDHGIRQEALRAISLASYHHAQENPRALMYGKPLDEKSYDSSRWIVEPFHLFDCCMENDGAAAIVMVSAERARDFPNKPVYVLGAAAGSGPRFGAQAHNSVDYASANFGTVAPDLYRMAKVSPADVGVVQSYENFTGGVLMALIEHGFFTPEAANDFLKPENLLAPSGLLPLNTSGGNLAECYMHGFELVLEAVRQVRGTSTSQANRSDVALVIGGPMVSPVSNLMLGSEAVL